MCGIVGVVSLEGRPIDLEFVRKMNNLQSHRGPDGEGFLIGTDETARDAKFVRHATQLENHCSTVALGHRRLAIIDLSDRGLQPMTVANSRTWIVFNGEIYNHGAIRSELQELGYKFHTRTDTEVILQAYLQWREECLSRFEGMYAFAIWDGVRGEAFCARDRFGIKPFYYAVSGGFFVFASEIKAVLAYATGAVEAEDDTVLNFLAHGNCDFGDRTIFKSVKALPPSHCMTVSTGKKQFSSRPYYVLKPFERGNFPHGKKPLDHLRELLTSSIRKHLISDVQIGSCLSGGIDSSAVVSLIGKLRRDDPAAAASVGPELRTFTSCYEQPEIDEREYALAVAEAVGAKPTLVFPSAEDFWTKFQTMAWHQDMPFGGLSYYAQWRVMNAAKDAGVKVLLDGQGGDEVFGGYAKFRYAYLLSLARAGRWSTFLGEFAAMIRQRDPYVLNFRKGYRYLPPTMRKFFKLDTLLRDVVKHDWDRVLMHGSSPATRWRANDNSPLTAVQRMQLDDIFLDTLPQLLRFEDRSSMAFSIEARVPLLDHKVVEYGISLPDSLKINRGWSKYAVRECLAGLLPEMVRTRRSKLGFAAPDRAWILHDMRPQISELLSNTLRCSKYVDVQKLRKWYASSSHSNVNTESCLGMFRLLSLEMWMRAFKV